MNPEDGREVQFGRSTGVIPVRGSQSAECLTPLQGVMFRLIEKYKQSHFLNMRVVLRLRGDVAPELMKRSMSWVADRHENLRATFPVIDGTRSRRVPTPPPEAPLIVWDLRDLNEAQREQVALERLSEESRRPFDLDRGPLWRIHLARLADNDWFLAITIHHLIADAKSHRILLEELSHAYNAFLVGKAPSLPGPAVQYGDYAAWLGDIRESDEYTRQLSSSLARLRDIPPLDLPLDQPRLPVVSVVAVEVHRKIEAGLFQAIRQMSRTEGCTTSMVMAAALEVLLARLSGQEHFSIGFAHHYRVPDVERLIGVFVDFAVLKVDLSDAPTFSQVISRVRESWEFIKSHPTTANQILRDVVVCPRDVSRVPMVEVALNIFDDPWSASRFGDAVGEFVAFKREASKVDMVLYAKRGVADVTLTLLSRSDLIGRERAEMILSQFIALLAAVSADPGRSYLSYSLEGGQQRPNSRPSMSMPAEIEEGLAVQVPVDSADVSSLQLDRQRVVHLSRSMLYQLRRAQVSLGAKQAPMLNRVFLWDVDARMGDINILRRLGFLGPVCVVFSFREAPQLWGFTQVDSVASSVRMARHLVPIRCWRPGSDVAVENASGIPVGIGEIGCLSFGGRRTDVRARVLLDGSIELEPRRVQTSRGFWVAPREVEAVVGEHPQVVDVLVSFDESTRGLLAEVVAPGLSNDALVQFLEEALPSYMVPDVHIGP